MKLYNATAAVAALVASTQAQRLSRQCSGDVCFALNIPKTTANSGSGDIFFQISGPTSYQWVGLGQGSQMAGSNMFVMYADGRGNVTLSPRHGTGHVMPEHDHTANVTLLEGSGISDGRMVANVLCANCGSWDGGSTDFTGSSGDWIMAARSGSAINSRSLTEEIEQHQAHGAFTWDYSTAKGGSSSINPFVARQDTSGGPSGGASGSTAVSPVPTSGSDGSGTSSVTTSSSETEDSGPSDTMVTAHGTLAAITFLVLFPLGALLIRIPGLSVWVHASVQIFSYCCFIAAAGLGIWMATAEKALMNAHPIIGMVLLGVPFFQPLGGVLHHRAYKIKQGRTVFAYAHVWLGRLAVLLGIINGGLGIQLSGGVEKGWIIAYGVVAGIVGVALLALAVYGEMRASRRPVTGNEHDRKHERSSS